MAFVYNRAGVVEDWECSHGYPSQACGCPSDSPVNNLCSKVGQHMMEWYRSLPEQSHVRLGKVEYMRYDEVPSVQPYRPNLQRLAGL